VDLQMESRKKQRSEEKGSADDSRLGRFEIVKETQRANFLEDAVCTRPIGAY